jgi:4-alpha-glucanotransferase
MSDSALNALADAAGIEARYWDIQGRLHERSPDTARHLLRALGLPSDSDVEIGAALVALAEKVWRETLPPVIVAKEATDIQIPVRLPLNAGGSLSWSIDRESGERLAGENSLRDLSVEATRDIDGATVVLYRLELPPQPLGYHRLRVAATSDCVTDLIVTPASGYRPDSGDARRYWGLSAQLYAVRSGKNWGIGDFGDLRTLVDWSAAGGAGFIGVNPFHALFLNAPENASPYSPSSRLFLNPLYLDVPAIPDFPESEAARSLAQTTPLTFEKHSDFINYPAVAAAKLAVLEALHSHFKGAHMRTDDERGRTFRHFVNTEGIALDRFTAFEALREKFGTHNWIRWPDCAGGPGTGETTRQVRDLRNRLSFFQYLQWQCDVQLGAVAERAKKNGMALGIYRDLAVGVDAASADHWANQEWYLRDMGVGAPPDPFNKDGQEWGVVPFNPRRLHAGRFVHFIEILRANMRHAGALRIDHAMGWQRLFVVPAGASPIDGAYLRYPLDDLLSIATLESRRNECVLIGEDLGTVPAGFREWMASTNVLSCRVLYFEQHDGHFRKPAEFPELAAVSATTHDLATLRGYWTAEDLAVKTALGLFKTEEDARQARDQREKDKLLLIEALQSEGLLPEGFDHAHATDAAWSPGLGNAVQIYLARSPALLLAVQLDDLACQQQQANLPGTFLEYPNWRRRLNRTLEDLAGDPMIASLAAALTQARGASST